MNNLPCVGIIIPIYNVESYLRECLDSVVNQTYQNLQIVLVDDGSTDASFSIAKEYFDRDERITLISQKNQGVSKARNVGLDYLLKTFEIGGGGDIQILEHSSSKSVEYIHFLDSDDWLELGCIEVCVRNALQTKAEIVWHGYSVYYQNENEKIENVCVSEYFLERDVYDGRSFLANMRGNGISVWCYLFDFSFWMKYRIKFIEGILAEDTLFGVQFFSFVKKICLVDANLVFYRIRKNSLSKFNLSEKETSFAPYQECITKVFQTNQEAFLYDFSYSRCVFVVEMIEFLQKNHHFFSDKLILQIERFIRDRAQGGFWVCKFKQDPKNARVLCERIWKYPQYCKRVELNSKIAFLFPRIFFVCRAILRYCKNLKYWIQSRF